MTSPRQARARERMVAMLAIGFCLGALATTYLAWRRDELGFGRGVRGGVASAPQSTSPAMVPGPDEPAGAGGAPPVVATAPVVLAFVIAQRYFLHEDRGAGWLGR